MLTAAQKVAAFKDHIPALEQALANTSAFTDKGLSHSFSRQTAPWLYRKGPDSWAPRDNCGTYLVNRPKTGFTEPGDLTARRQGRFKEHAETLKDLAENAGLEEYESYIRQGLADDGYIEISNPDLLLAPDYTTGILVFRDRNTFFSPEVDLMTSDYHWFAPILDDQGQIQLAQKTPSRPPTCLKPVNGESIVQRMFDIAINNGYRNFGGFHRADLNPTSPAYIDYDRI